MQERRKKGKEELFRPDGTAGDAGLTLLEVLGRPWFLQRGSRCQKVQETLSLLRLDR